MEISVGDFNGCIQKLGNACAVNNMVDALGDCGAANSVDLQEMFHIQCWQKFWRWMGMDRVSDE